MNFKIAFVLSVRKPDGAHRESNLFYRIIRAQSEKYARLVAKAMLGEEVFPNMYLAEVQGVSKTHESPSISSFCSKHYTWDRVLQVLGLWGDVGDVVNHYFSHTSTGEEVSGLFLTERQYQIGLSRAGAL